MCGRRLIAAALLNEADGLLELQADDRQLSRNTARAAIADLRDFDEWYEDEDILRIFEYQPAVAIEVVNERVEQKARKSQQRSTRLV